jgi:copper oxidase (laccase) domain-containing protein
VTAKTFATVAGAVQLRFTSRADGDFHADLVHPEVRRAHQLAVVDLPWTLLREEHGTEVVVVDAPGQHDGASGDALVTCAPDAVLGIWVGDCAPVALVGDGVLGAVHAGWRGVRDGVLAAAVRQMRDVGATEIEAHVGPCIGACCYEFGLDDLEDLCRHVGGEIATTTTAGVPALDLVAMVRVSLAAVDVALVSTGPCTACDERYWSHRRGDLGRQAMAVWRTAAT